MESQSSSGNSVAAERMASALSEVNRRTFMETLGLTTAGLALVDHGPAGADVLPAQSAGTTSSAPVALPQRPLNWLSLDRGWRFHLGDMSQRVSGHRASVDSAKAGGATGPAAPGFDDTGWRELNLPHDWVVEGPFAERENIAQGYRRRGIGWYRRALRLEETDRGKHFELQFDGIATHATIWFNGTLVRRSSSGYASSYVDITPYLRFGNRINTIAVRVDADVHEGWWYEGGGIYRHVWLVQRGPVHIVSDGLYAMPRFEQAKQRWRVPVEAIVRNTGTASAEVALEISIVDSAGVTVARAAVPAKIQPLAQQAIALDMPVESPALWSVADPNLYEIVARLRVSGRDADELAVKTGFRTIRFDPQQGFFLNGEQLKIKGACIHQDHAGVGVALPDSIHEFRLRRLREMGANAIRVSHHAPTAELLDLADRMGFLVMDENRNFGLDEETIEQLEWLVRRDRNRPSVFAWVIFNEEPWQGNAAGREMARRMIAHIKTLDDSRPVTAAMHGGLYAPENVSQVVDLVGLNYQHSEYDRYHAAHPNRPMISTEDGSAFMTRGEWYTDLSKNVFAANDQEAARWGLSHRESWKLIAERPFMAGGFVWTGFDYRGEPTPFTWPSASTFFGAMDLCGFAKTGYQIRRALWMDKEPVLYLAPHWTWPGREGQPIQVMAITNAEEVEIRLNGRRIARLPVDRYMMASIDIPYAPGRLEARAFSGGRLVASSANETSGPPAALVLTADRPRLTGDGRDAQPISVAAVDGRGKHVPNAGNAVTFQIEDGGIIGLGNGNPNSHEAEKGNIRSLFNGLAQVIVQAPRGPGRLRLTATSPGLRPAITVVPVHRARFQPEIAPAPVVQFVERWRQSPGSAGRPDPSIPIPDYDANTWTNFAAGDPAPIASSSHWVMIRGQFLPHAAMRERGGIVTFNGLEGPAEVWLDGRRIADGHGTGTLRVPLPPGDGPRTLTVLVRTSSGKPFGLTDVVTVEP